MNIFLDNLRDAFYDANAQSGNRRANIFTGKHSAQEILDSMKFVDVDEPIPDDGIIYTPFVWNTEKGERQHGLLVHSGDNIYGLERGDGTSMTSTGVKNMLQKMVRDGKSSFSDPFITTGFASRVDNGPQTGSTELINYNLFGKKAADVGKQLTDSFLQKLRDAANSRQSK